MPQHKMSVFGAGAWGTALSFALCRNEVDVLLWGHNADPISEMQAERCHVRFFPDIAFPDNLQLTQDLATAAEYSHDWLIVVPSHAFRGLIQQLRPHVSESIRIAWATKGLDPATNDCLHHTLNELLPVAVAQAVLSGPSFAKEVILGQPTAVNIASHDDVFLADLTRYFHQKTFRIYPSDDVIGVQLGGAVKNVLAIAVGISDGLGFGANTRCALITRGLAEMCRLGEAMGANPETFAGLAGVGDLMLTCTDNQSRNRQFGLRLGQGELCVQAQEAINGVVEGYGNTLQVLELADKLNVSMPITEEVHQVLYHNKPALAAVEALLARDVIA